MEMEQLGLKIGLSGPLCFPVFWCVSVILRTACKLKHSCLSNSSEWVCFCRGKISVLKIVPKYEPLHEKTGFLHMRKQRRRSASW